MKPKSAKANTLKVGERIDDPYSDFQIVDVVTIGEISNRDNWITLYDDKGEPIGTLWGNDVVTVYRDDGESEEPVPA